MWFILVLLFNFILAIWCFRRAVLSKIGIIMAWSIGIIIIICNIQAYILLVCFFLLTICTERLICVQDNCRTYAQVLCNSIPALLVLLAWFTDRKPYYLLVYACLIASSTSDSIASAIGNKYAQNVYSVVSWKKIEKGLSGGVSLQGSMAGLLASLCIAFAFVITGEYCNIIKECIFVITILGSFGMIIDSVLGAFFQKKYKCVICNRVVEKHVHCGENTLPISAPWMILTNNSVNLVSNIILLSICIACESFVSPF